MDRIEQHIEERIAELDPAIELIALERPRNGTLRLFIDHPGGVDLALCERVTKHLPELLADHSLEVSSPGLDRPLTKPEHFRRFVGHEIKVTTTAAIEGRRNFKGRLAAAGDEAIELEDSGHRYELPLSDLKRSNLVPEPMEVRP